MISQNEIIKQKCFKISNMINKGNYKEAIQTFNILESKYSKNITIRFNKVGIFIDAGFGLKNENIIIEGVKVGIELLKEELDKIYLSNLHYNIANGYMSLYQLSRDKSEDLNQIPDNENIQNAKNHYRNSIKHIDLFDYKLKKTLWTNYGNCLDSLGRGLESIFCYEQALKPDSRFAMALGNRAKAMRFFADISGVYRGAIYVEAYQMLKSAIEQNNLIQHGGLSAKESFEDEIEKIEYLFKDKKVLLWGLVLFAVLLLFMGIRYKMLDNAIHGKVNLLNHIQEIYDVIRIDVIGGHEFEVTLKDERKIHAMLKVRTTNKSKDRVINYISHSTKPQVILYEKVNGIWIVDLIFNGESLTDWLHEEGLVLE